jgi:hypothetical protein
MLLAGAALALRGEQAVAQCGPIPVANPLHAGSSANLVIGGGTTNVNGNAVSGSGNVLQASGVRTNLAAALPPLDPATFPSFTSSLNASTSPVAGGTYSSVAANSAGFTFTGGTYYITTLNVNASSVTFGPGTYYIQNLSLPNGFTLNISPAGPVNIFLGSNLGSRDDVRLNPGGDPANLRVYVYPNANLHLGNNWSVTGLVYTPGTGRIQFGNNGSLNGALVGAGRVDVGNNTNITFNAATNTGLTGSSTCRGPLAEYRFEQTAYTGAAGEVLDTGSGTYSAQRSGNAASTADGRVCRGVTIPSNASAAPVDGIRTPIDVETRIGNRGTISLWYRSNTVWVGGGNRMLFDASDDSTGNFNVDKFFYLVLTSAGQLNFGAEAANDQDQNLISAAQSVPAGTWRHLAVTWDFPSGQQRIYYEGALLASRNISSGGTGLGNVRSLIFGDNSSNYQVNGSVRNSANGIIDQVRIYNTVRTATEIAADRDFTHPCTAAGVAAFQVTTAATGSTCLAQSVTIRALNASATTLTTYTGTVNLVTSTGRGGWAASGTSGPVTENGNGNDGVASYTFRAADNGVVTLLLNYQSADSGVLVTAADTVTTSATGVSGAIAFADNAFVVEEDLSGLVAGAGTAVAGRPHDMRVTLWRRDVSQTPANCAIADGYAGTRNLKAWLSLDPLHPAGATAPSIDAPAPGTDLAAVPSVLPGANNLSLAFSGGVASFTLNTTDVGKYVLNLRDDSRHFANAVDITGSSTMLTVRPFAIAVTAVSKGAITNPGGSATSGGAFVAAGDTFSATVGGYLWNAADDANNDGLPDSGATNVINNGLAARFAWPATLAPASTASPFFSPAGGVLGTLTGTTTVAQAAFAGGVATVSDLRYSEVGSIGLDATVTGYLGTVGVDLTGTVVNASGQPVAVGRFFPERFELLAGAAVTPFCGAAGGFVYMDQPALGLAFTVEARNALNVRTQNYRTAGYVVGLVSMVAENSDAGANLGGRLAGLPAGTWVAGSYAVNAASVLFSRLPAPDGPYESLVLGVIATDPDGARLAARDMNASAPGCGGGCDARALNAASPVRARFGRLRVGNAVGSPLLGLPVPLSVEFWNGSGFVRNAQDSCTTLTNRNFTFAAFTAPLAACSTSGTPVTAGGITFASGASSVFRLTAPGVRGSVDIRPNLGATATGQTCSAGAATAATAAGAPWLLGNWGGAATWDRNPTGRAAFGLYTNTPDLIYRRESY